MNSFGLLETIKSQVGCMFISDLHDHNLLIRIQHRLHKINAEDYTLCEWIDAVEYITGIKKQFKTAMDAKKFLLNYIQ